MMMIEGIVAAALAALAPVSAQAAGAPATGCTAAQREGCLAGAWTGAFIGADWTFEFRREGDRWTGRYMTSRTNRWRPLSAVAVKGDRVTFAIEGTTPAIGFTLAVAAAGDALAGEALIDGHARIPFSATRGGGR